MASCGTFLDMLICRFISRLQGWGRPVYKLVVGNLLCSSCQAQRQWGQKDNGVRACLGLRDAHKIISFYFEGLSGHSIFPKGLAIDFNRHQLDNI